MDLIYSYTVFISISEFHLYMTTNWYHLDSIGEIAIFVLFRLIVVAMHISLAWFQKRWYKKGNRYEGLIIACMIHSVWNVISMGISLLV